MFSTVLLLFGSREAGCFSEGAASRCSHFRQVPLYLKSRAPHVVVCITLDCSSVCVEVDLDVV